jgi:Flagellar motor switch protein
MPLTQSQQASFDEMPMAEKIAILLLMLGEDSTSAIFSNMSVDAITEVSKFIANNKSVDRNIGTAILEEFYAIFQSGQFMTSGGMEYARELLYRTLGAEEAKKVMEKLTRVCKILKTLHIFLKLSRSSYQTLLSPNIPKQLLLF